MDSIFIEGTPKTPNIDFDHGKGSLLLKGRSIPENSIEFYKPLVDWLDAYSSSPKPKTVCDVQLEYFNTSSSKCLLDLFKKMELKKKKGDHGGGGTIYIYTASCGLVPDNQPPQPKP